MPKKTIIFCSSLVMRLAAIIIIIAVISLLSFFAWVYTGPRSLDTITPYVQERINNELAPYHIEINRSYIKWDSLQKAIIISSTDTQLLDKTNELIAIFPEILLDFNVFKILMGQFASSDITLINPNIFLAEHSTETTPSINKNQATIDLEEVVEPLYEYLKQTKLPLQIRHINIRNAKLHFDNGFSNIVWNIEQGYLQLKKLELHHQLVTNFDLNFGDGHTTQIQSWLTPSPSQTLETKIEFTHVTPVPLKDLFPNHPVISMIDTNLNGSLTFNASPEGQIPHLSLMLKQSDITVTSEKHFEKPLPISNLSTHSLYYPESNELVVQDLSFYLDKSQLEIKGSFKPILSTTESPLEFVSEIKLSDISVFKLKEYWPKLLAPNTRSWVKNHMISGHIPSATASLAFTKEDYALISLHEQMNDNGQEPSPPPLSEDMIRATIALENAIIAPHARYPKFSDVDATITFTPQSMTATLNKAQLSESTIESGGTINLPDLWQTPNMIHIDTTLEGPASDTIMFLKQSLSTPPTNQMLQSVYDMSGHMRNRVILKFPAINELSYDDMDLLVSSKLDNGSFPKFFNGNDLNDTQLSINLNNRNLSLRGTTALNSTPLSVTASRDFLESGQSKGFTKLSGTISTQTLKDNRILSLPYIDGIISATVEITDKNNIETFEGVANVIASDIQIPTIAYTKKTGEAGTIEFKASLKDNELTLNRLNLEGTDYKLNGTLSINDITTEILSSADFKTIRFGSNDLSAKYLRNDTGYQLALSGQTLDLGKLPFDQLYKPDEVKQSVKVTANLNQVILKNKVTTTDVVANMDCDLTKCHSVNLYGKLPNDRFLAASLKPLGQHIMLLIESNDAGSVIKGLGISKHIKGGFLNIQSTALKNNGHLVAQGNININDFTAIKTPLLGKLLTLASFKGFSDLLSDKGITFKTFDAPFTLSGGVVTIKDAKTSGSSIGITSNGTVNSNTGIIDIKGLLVPAQEINQLLNKIPVLGTLMTGGKDQGIIATRYSIKGTYEDAEISVNPLSTLTPSFLRNIFDAFE